MKRYPQRDGEPLTRVCGGKAGGCHEVRWIEEFRILTNGYRCTYCIDCETEYARERNRSPNAPEVIPVGLRIAGCDGSA